MTDDELRQLVQASIAKHLGSGTDPAAPFTRIPESASLVHASHGLLPLARGSDGDGACLIEPTVRCNHCGYCLSYGH